MSVKVAQALAKGRRKVYASIPLPIRALHALVRIARVKVAFSKNDINRIVDQMMTKEGVYKRFEKQGLTPPDINYGDLFYIAVNTVGRKFRFSQQQREDYLNDIVGDMVMGKSIITLRGTGEWKHNLTEQVAIWVEDGWSDDRIKKTLVKWIMDKVMNLAKRERAERGPVTETLEQGRPNSDAMGIYEDMFTMDGLTKSQMSHYQTLMRTNHDARNLVQKIQKVLERRNDELGYLWQAYTSDPSATMRDLVYAEVRTPEGVLPLWEALGYPDATSNVAGKVHFQIKKLRAYLESQWPVIQEVLAEMD